LMPKTARERKGYMSGFWRPQITGFGNAIWIKDPLHDSYLFISQVARIITGSQ